MSDLELPPTTPAGEGLAPVALFAYKRVGHLRRTIDSLRLNAEAAATDLVVFSDAAKGTNDETAVHEVRAYLDTVTGFRSVRRVERPYNFGLARSIVGGVGEILQTHDRLIVLEDDLLLSPHFLRFMNDGLQRYRDEPRVACIHGYVYPAEPSLPETFFLRGADCWGWATWSRAWRHFDADGARLMAELESRRLTRDFDLGDNYPFTRMLDRQIRGQNDSWAIRWHASCFLAGLLTLYPGRSLVRNLGNDATGTHGEDSDDFAVELSPTAVRVAEIPVEASTAARDAIGRYLGSRRSVRSRLGQWIHSLSGR